MIHSALLVPLLAPAVADGGDVSGVYVESRTASVFAGACHYNGEFVTVGRDALCAWRIESGSYAGVELAGAAVVAVVSADANLDERGARRSVILVDRDDAPERAAAAARWLGATRAGLVGDVLEVRVADLDVALDGESYRVGAPGIELAGAALPDRACCAMPQLVWYRPLEPLAGAVVGRDESFAVASDALGRAWSRPGDNAAFTGRFGAR